ncbi:MAG: hypothetical protein WBL77_09795, partial [Pseudolabrys sp.]
MAMKLREALSTLVTYCQCSGACALAWTNSRWPFFEGQRQLSEKFTLRAVELNPCPIECLSGYR